MNKITLTINKKKVEFRFGLGFIGNALEKLDISINELGDRLTKNPFLYAPKLMFYSMKYANERKGNEVDLSYESFLDSLDDDNSFSNGNIGKFIDSFTKSLMQDVPKSEDKGDTKKK